MRFGFMWWWLIPLMFWWMMSGRHRRRYRRMEWQGDRDTVAELRRTVEDQRGYIEELEARLSRVEDGLEFAERLLAERGAVSAG
jgi:hypothetical protein